ncbi:MAG: AI-2E family transporter [Anaerolineae bacterium]
MSTPMPPTLPTESAVYQPDWALWVRQFIAVGLVILGVWALTLLAPVLNILITTFLLCFVMFVPARVLAWRTPLHYSVCVLLMFFVVLLAIFVLILVITPALLELITSLIRRSNDTLLSVQTALRDWNPALAPRYTVALPFGFTVDLTDIAAPLRETLVSEDPQAALQQLQTALFSSLPVNIGAVASSVATTVGSLAIAFIGSVSSFTSTLVASLLLSLIILLELPRYQQSALNSFPEHQRELRLLGHKIMRVWQGFFRGQLFLCLVIGILTYLQLMLMGLQSAFIVAVIVAVISLIPTLGGILALIPLFIMPLIQGSSVFTEMERLPYAVLVVIINLVISQIIWNGIAPKVMGDAVNLPLPLIILGIIVGSAVGGALGAFLIVPMLGMVRVIIAYLIAKVMRQDPFPGELTPDVIELSAI